MRGSPSALVYYKTKLPRQPSPPVGKKFVCHGHCNSPLAISWSSGHRKNLMCCFGLGLSNCLHFRIVLHTTTVCDDHERGLASRDLPSPVSHEAYWIVPKYICCKNYGCNGSLTRINLPCGMDFCRQVWRLCPIKFKFQDVDTIASTLTMSSSNEEKPVKLLALGEVSII